MESNWKAKFSLILATGLILYIAGCGTQNSQSAALQQGAGSGDSTTPPAAASTAPTKAQCLASIAQTACPMFCLATPVVCSATQYNGNPIQITVSDCNSCIAKLSVETQACNAGYTDLSELTLSCPST
jgi:hypothetical protein